MAKFLNTTGVSYHLEELIKGTKDRLILISPYLQFHQRIKDHLENLNIQKKDIRIVYRENKLKVEESNWLESQIGVRTSICNTLHAKCYINEKEAIVTSMNLYSFSQQNNDEMGILVDINSDPELYKDIADEAQRLLTISEGN
jgi:phosphatidylserine/phosphatidylglycerophosphate/cardiolipin synthase-like enzyme